MRVETRLTLDAIYKNNHLTALYSQEEPPLATVGRMWNNSMSMWPPCWSK